MFTDVVTVYNAQVVNGTLDTIYGTAVLATEDGSAKLNVTFDIEAADCTYINYVNIFVPQHPSGFYWTYFYKAHFAHNYHSITI